MSNKLRNTMIIFMWIALCIPFVFQTDLYPFLRFKMFSQSSGNQIPTSQFLIQSTDSAGIRKILPTNELGIEATTFDLLVNNYHFRNQTQDFLIKLSKKLQFRSGLQTLDLLQINKTDTTKVATLKMHE